MGTINNSHDDFEVGHISSTPSADTIEDSRTYTSRFHLSSCATSLFISCSGTKGWEAKSWISGSNHCGQKARRINHRIRSRREHQGGCGRGLESLGNREGHFCGQFGLRQAIARELCPITRREYQEGRLYTYHNGPHSIRQELDAPRCSITRRPANIRHHGNRG